jgi:hypothetical protein
MDSLVQGSYSASSEVDGSTYMTGCTQWGT